MDIGTGIFLSSLVIGFVLLYNANRDRWNWKKVSIGIFVVVALLGVFVLVHSKIESSKHQRLINEARRF